MLHSRFWVGLHQLTMLAALSACGGGGGSPPATVRTIAYAPAECREDATRRSTRQELRIRQGEGVPVTVTEATETYMQEPPVLPGACGLAGTSRFGLSNIFAGGVQRLGVSPDGSTVVFEKTNRFSVIGLPQLASDREGFFLVHADGSGLRRLSAASRESLTRLAFDTSGLRTDVELIPLSVSADGRTIVFTDRGPGPADEDAAQIVTMDLATGERTQVTRMPRAAPANPPDPVRRDVCCPSFLPDGTIIFFTFSNPNGLDPEGAGRIYTVRPDGDDLKLVPLPDVLPGSIDPTIQITGDRPTMIDIGGLPGGSSEVFLYDRGNLLQLSNFHRPDTGRGTLAVGGRRALFVASADPFGTNSSENCQIFSVDTLGADDLRQLTDFNQGEHSTLGCGVGPNVPPGCTVQSPLRRDPATGVVVFASSCDPFGTNSNGEQIFAMNPDGTRLRQLTNTRGYTTAADGTVDGELPGPFASTAVER